MKKNKIYIFLFNFLTLITYFFVQNANANFISAGGSLDTSNYAIRAFDLSAQLTDAREVTLSNDGKKMFTIDTVADDVFEYTLSTPYDISTAVFVHSFSQSETNRPFSVRFNNEGSKMFIADRSQANVFEYSLSRKFDISSATYTGNSISVSSQVGNGNLFGLAFSPDGTMMFVNELTDGTGNHLHQYS